MKFIVLLLLFSIVGFDCPVGAQEESFTQRAARQKAEAAYIESVEMRLRRSKVLWEEEKTKASMELFGLERQVPTMKSSGLSQGDYHREYPEAEYMKSIKTYLGARDKLALAEQKKPVDLEAIRAEARQAEEFMESNRKAVLGNSEKSGRGEKWLEDVKKSITNNHRIDQQKANVENAQREIAQMKSDIKDGFYQKTPINSDTIVKHMEGVHPGIAPESAIDLQEKIQDLNSKSQFVKAEKLNKLPAHLANGSSGGSSSGGGVSCLAGKL